MASRQYQPAPSSSGQRDAAFSNIFGAAPPPGRSQTMTNTPPQIPQDRAQTMSGATGQYVQRAPPMGPGAMLPQQPNGVQYPPLSTDGRPMNGMGGQQGPYSGQPGAGPQRRPIPPPGQQQGLPQPIRGDRLPYGQPQRMDPRGGPPPPGSYGRSFTARGPMPPNPAMRDDPYRSQSLASQPRQPIPPPGQGGAYGIDAARTFRQQPYQANQMARTTAQGRVVPDRPADERTMSMSSYSRSEYEAGGGTTTMSGRVIPGRPGQRRESSGSPEAVAAPGQRFYGSGAAPGQEYQRAQTMTNGYHPELQRKPNGSVAHQQYGANGRNPSSGSAGSRTMSIASTVISPGADTISSRPSTSTQASSATAVPPSTATRNNSQLSHTPSTMVAQKKPSLVYGALLSNVANAFRDRIPLSEKEKDGLVYQNAFTGYEAVDLISYIIRTSDRNLALLLGRSLDAQKYFHEVAYAHRLRDSPQEIYQFKETLGTGSQEAIDGTASGGEVNGVFTLLTECYSPTCNRDNLCYSIACPRRLEQQSRLNLKQTPGLKKEASAESLHADDDDPSGGEQKLWINTVPADVAARTSDREKKRQEVISELAYTERDFVKDLEYLRDFWIRPLRNPETSPIPEHRREKFVRSVFGNVQEIHAVNARLAAALTRRQQVNPVVDRVGDVLLEALHGGMLPASSMGTPQGGDGFGGFVKYGANQLFGKYEFERERQNNPAFSRFVEQTERLKESRKLELNGYLTKPTTRLARYPLLLEGILKSTEGDELKNGEVRDGKEHADRIDIPKAVVLIRGVLHRVNEESGKAENHFNMVSLNQQLKWGGIQYMDLKLTEETRQLIFKSSLKKAPTSESADIGAYLFDHAVLLVRVKSIGKGREEMRVYRKPIPLELLQIKEMDTVLPRQGIAKRPSSSMVPSLSMGGRTATMTTNKSGADQGWPITFKGLGKGGYEITLFCTTQIQREKWMEHIATQKHKLAERHNVFTMTTLSEGFFSGAIKVACCRPIDGGRKLVIGTDMGVYVTDRKPRDASMKPKRVLDVKLVSQLEVLEQHGTVIVLADKVVYSYPLDVVLESDDSSSSAAAVAGRRGRRICHANYVSSGMCNGSTLVCCVKSSSLSSTVKVYEPMDSMTKGKKKSGLARMMGAGQEVLKPFKEFYIPMESNSIHFLRSKLCVGGAKGFEIVSLETLETQSLLDQADTSLDFVTRAAHNNSTHPLRPIYIERNTSEFLLCYTDFSFYVNKNGWRARGDWKILWEGAPQAFATWGEKYILAFEPEFIEVRSSETGGLVCIECHKNIRFLHQSTREILFAYEDEIGHDVVASLDFWGRPQSPQTHSSR